MRREPNRFDGLDCSILILLAFLDNISGNSTVDKMHKRDKALGGLGARLIFTVLVH